MLSGLSAAAGLVLAPKSEGAMKHIEFVPLGPGRALVVLVNGDGQVENRVIETPPGLPPSALQQASNYLNARCRAGRWPNSAGSSARRWRRTAPSSTPCPRRWWPPGWPPGPARAAPAA